MVLRSGNRRPVRKTQLEDDGEEWVTEHQTDEAIETIHEDAVNRENGTPEANVPLFYKRSTSTDLKRVWRNITKHQLYIVVTEGQKAVYLFFLIIVLLILFMLYFFRQPNFCECDSGSSGSDCSLTLYELSQEYPQLKTFWREINHTYTICSKTNNPGVVLLLHNGDGSVVDCILNRTAPSLSRLICVSQSGEYLLVDGRSAHEDYDVNEFMENVINLRQKYGVVIFTYLEQMDSRLFENLHYICDSDNNTANKFIIILVLKVEMQSFEDTNLEDMANRQIVKLWEEKLRYRLQPIIGRITNVVASIDEKVFTKCP